MNYLPNNPPENLSEHMAKFHPDPKREPLPPIQPLPAIDPGGKVAIISAGESVRELTLWQRTAICSAFDTIVAINHAGEWIRDGKLKGLTFDIWATMDAHLPKNAHWRADITWDGPRLREGSTVKGSRFSFPFILDKVYRELRPKELFVFGVDMEGGGLQGKKPEKDRDNGRWEEEGAKIQEILARYPDLAERTEWLGKWKP